MKLAKKMLASVLALAMVAALALTAFAAAPAMTMTAKDAVVGETVEISVAGKDMVGLQSADLVFDYDADALEYVGVKKSSAVEFDMATGGNPAAGQVTFSFAFLEAAKADSELCVITFKVLKAGDTTVKGTASSWDGTDMPGEASVVVKAHEPVVITTAAPTTAEPTSATPSQPTTGDKITQTGEASIAAIAGVMALAAVAFVVTKKKDEE